MDKDEVEELFKDNYKSYEKIEAYDNEYWKKVNEHNLTKNFY